MTFSLLPTLLALQHHLGVHLLHQQLLVVVDHQLFLLFDTKMLLTFTSSSDSFLSSSLLFIGVTIALSSLTLSAFMTHSPTVDAGTLNLLPASACLCLIPNSTTCLLNSGVYFDKCLLSSLFLRAFLIQAPTIVEVTLNVLLVSHGLFLSPNSTTSLSELRCISGHCRSSISVGCDS